MPPFCCAQKPAGPVCCGKGWSMMEGTMENYKGSGLGRKRKGGADLLIQTNKYHKKSNRTLILIMQPLELR